ncbi:MAG: ABC transporter substrate-binding protein [Patescibacteria group bacterium]
MKTSIKFGLIAVLIILVIIVVIKGAPKTRAISIGAVIPETGFGSYWGAPVRKGVEVAEADLQKKYGAENVHIFIEDSQSSVSVSATVAQKLLSVEKVDALYTEFSGISAAVSSIAQSARKVLVYSTFNQKIVEDNPMSIKTFVSFEVACDAFAQRLNDSSKKVLIISAIGDAAPYCKKGLEKTLADENIKVIEGFAGTDFRTVLLQNKEFDPDYIIPIMYEDGSYALLKQKGELGIPGELFCYRQDCVTQKVLKELPPAYTEGTLFFEVRIDELFAAKMKAKFPDMSDDDIQAAANAYQSIMVLGNALAQCSGAEATCVTSKIANLEDLSVPGYKDAFFRDRVLRSDIGIGEVKNGKAELK